MLFGWLALNLVGFCALDAKWAAPLVGWDRGVQQWSGLAFFVFLCFFALSYFKVIRFGLSRFPAPSSSTILVKWRPSCVRNFRLVMALSNLVLFVILLRFGAFDVIFSGMNRGLFREAMNYQSGIVGQIVWLSSLYAVPCNFAAECYYFTCLQRRAPLDIAILIGSGITVFLISFSIGSRGSGVYFMLPGLLFLMRNFRIRDSARALALMLIILFIPSVHFHDQSLNEALEAIAVRSSVGEVNAGYELWSKFNSRGLDNNFWPSNLLMIGTRLLAFIGFFEYGDIDGYQSYSYGYLLMKEITGESWMTTTTTWPGTPLSFGVAFFGEFWMIGALLMGAIVGLHHLVFIWANKKTR
jgi:hypothetical protein